MRYRVKHSKIKFVSTRRHVIRSRLTSMRVQIPAHLFSYIVRSRWHFLALPLRTQSKNIRPVNLCKAQENLQPVPTAGLGRVSRGWNRLQVVPRFTRDFGAFECSDWLLLLTGRQAQRVLEGKSTDRHNGCTVEATK